MLFALYLFSTNKFKKGHFDKIYNILMDVVKIPLIFFNKKCKNIVIKDLKLTENHYFTKMDRLDDILGCKIHFFQISKKFSKKKSAGILQNISTNTTFLFIQIFGKCWITGDKSRHHKCEYVFPCKIGCRLRIYTCFFP